MFNFLFSKLQNIGIAILGIFSLFLLGRNSKLSKKNRELNSAISNQSNVIEIQKKVINVTKNSKPTDINGNIERMRNGKF